MLPGSGLHDIISKYELGPSFYASNKEWLPKFASSFLVPESEATILH